MPCCEQDDALSINDVSIREPFRSGSKSTTVVSDECDEMSSPESVDLDDLDDIEIADILIGEEAQQFSQESYAPEMDIEGDAKLYSGSQVSTIQATTMLLSWFTSHPDMSKQSLNSLLHLLHKSILPPGNLLPSSYKQAKQYIQPYLSPVNEYHCCINDCVVFRDSSVGKFSKLTTCPVCDEPRYKPDKKTPVKRFSGVGRILTKRGVNAGFESKCYSVCIL